MKVLSKSVCCNGCGGNTSGRRAFAVAGTAYAADNDAITVTPNPWYANSFDGWGHLAGLVRQSPPAASARNRHHHQSRR